jgi:hypothetical protein
MAALISAENEANIEAKYQRNQLSKAKSKKRISESGGGEAIKQRHFAASAARREK